MKQSNRKSQGKKYFFCILFAGILILLYALFFCFFRPYYLDYRQISSRKYDTVLLSMYPQENYDTEILSYYRGMNALLTGAEIPNASVLKLYLRQLASSGNVIQTIYLGITPDKISAKQLCEITALYPSVHFEVILSYPSLSHWAGLSDAQCTEFMNAYRSFSPEKLVSENISLYLYSMQEWVTGNPACYEDDFTASVDLASWILRTADSDHGFLLTAENAEQAYTQMSQLIASYREEYPSYPDWSDKSIVFFGDSIIGNYTDCSSIPGVVAGLTQAKVYNCGLGGSSASGGETEDAVTLPTIVDGFIKGDLSPFSEDMQCYQGISSYLSASEAINPDQLCFVISYGLNDFFIGHPVQSEDSFDVKSYEGAFRTAIARLREAFPEAQFLLLTPTPNIYHDFGNGKGSDEGGTLVDYVNSILSLGEEYQIPVLNSYKTLGITRQNYQYKLLDGCHLNEATRYEMGKQIIRTLLLP